MKKKRYSTLEYLLLALVPYTDSNLKLAYKPNQFFNELERITEANAATLRMSMYRAEQAGLLHKASGTPRLTEAGQARIAKFTAQRISQQGELMVIFDIPEELVHKRQKFRNFLKQLEFHQVQKSVWVTKYDYREELLQAVEDLGIDRYIQLYECAKLYPIYNKN